jgi:excisionase family DNA binding protein
MIFFQNLDQRDGNQGSYIFSGMILFERVVLPAGLDGAEMMTLREVDEYLNCHNSTVNRLARAGELPAFHLGSDWRFRRSDLERWIAAGDGRPQDGGGRARGPRSKSGR